MTTLILILCILILIICSGFYSAIDRLNMSIVELELEVEKLRDKLFPKSDNIN